MTAPTYEELQAENERLLTANDNLARHVIASSARLEEGKRELLAIGWDAAVAALVDEDGDPVGIVTNVNPYRQPFGFGGDE